jgi:predicted nucleotide-binding protein
MVGMPARRPRNSPNELERPEPSVLRLPLSDAEAQLDARVAAGRELVDIEAAGLEARLATAPYARHMYSPGAKPQGDQEVDAFSRGVGQWRDYNRTWLDRNLGGEASEEYKETSTHWNFGGADDPRINLRFLVEDVELEISKLESIRGRLSMWLPPGAIAPTSGVARSAEADEGGRIMFATNRKLVMVIYGHDKEANDALFDWLRAIGLQPQEWSQVIRAAGSASPYIGQALERAFSNAQAVVAFFTPDERVLARSASSTDLSAWRMQARPNVLIEAGMALTTHPDRTVLVMLGDQQLPSDLAGRHYVRLSRTSAAPLHDLTGRLEQAGCDTDTTGTAWLDPARFPDRDHIDPAPT